MSKEKVPLRAEISYAAVTLGSTTIWSFLSGWLLYFYMPPDDHPLVPAALYGGAMFATRALDALVNPPIGYLSDHTRSRWGRRLPFMFAAALPMLVFFVLLWTPPVDGESIWNLVYLVVILELYSIAYSFVQIPYSALLPELAPDDRCRVRIAAWSSAFQMVALILGGLAGMAIERAGYTGAALLYAGIALPLFYLPLLVLRERPGRQIAADQRLSFRNSLRVTLQNRAFLIYAATWALYWTTMAFVQSSIPFIATEVCLLSTADTMYFYIPAVLTSLLCYPALTWLVGRLGKRTVYSGSLLASTLALPAAAFIGPWLPIPLKAQGIAWAILQAVALSGAAMLPPAFAAEIADHDEALTGQRREGAYYAVWGLLDHVVGGAAAAALPLLLLLGRSRLDPHGPLGVRMVGIIGGILMLAAFLIFQRYPLRAGVAEPQEVLGSEAGL